MIKSKRELKKFVKEEIYKATGVKANVEYVGVSREGYGSNYFVFKIDCPSLKDFPICNGISFHMGEAKKDYFEEGFTLKKEDVLFEINATIVGIKKALSER